jgi:hypothetical protein
MLLSGKTLQCIVNNEISFYCITIALCVLLWSEWYNVLIILLLLQ